ncbi:MAG: T9SS type A sorting domain-containing protein, partial [Cytophagales bacterium]
ITPGVGIDVTQWSSPSNWVSIEDNSTSTWKYFAYNNEFTGLFNPSGILDRQDPGVDAPSCAVQDICFPLARIMATLDIDENSKELVIYPNPSKEMIQIRSAGEKTIELIRIYDIALSKSPIELYLTGKRIEMNISVLTSGLYFLEVWNKDGSRDFARLIKK